MRHPLAILLGTGVGFVVLAGAMLVALGGAVVPASTLGGHWSLTRDDGVRVSERDFRGRYTLMFFGYTTCRDVCPATLVSVADAMRDLGQDAARVQPVFVTVDPQHDTSEVVHRYVRQFGPSLEGLTGTDAEIARVEERFGVHATPPAAAATREEIEHDAVLLLLGPDGSYLTALPVTESGQQIASRLMYQLSRS